ncbi:MAG: ABC transporter permease [Thermoplasmata archaeon]|nr:MAG: ABC transporter permease [Thermoplasmata archaeon]
MIARNVFRRKGRTVMSILAVAISMILLISMLSIAEGIWLTAQEDVSKGREDILVTSGFIAGASEIVYGHELADRLRADTTNISESAPFDGGLLQASKINSNESGPVIAMGLIPERSRYFLNDDNEIMLDQMKIKFHDWFDVPGDPHFENNYTGPWTYEVMVDKILASNFGLSRGSNVNINAGPGLNITFRVAGLFETEFAEGGLFGEFFKGIIILHLSEFQTLKHTDINVIDNKTVLVDKIGGVTLGLQEDKRNPEDAAEIALALKDKYPQYTFWTKEDQLEWYHDNIVTARIYYTAIASVSITIGILFVTCIMIMSVNERKNEIGMMRAIGVSRKSIFTNILMESVFIVFLGAVVGIIPGYLGSVWLGDYISDIYGYNRTLTAFTLPMVTTALTQLLVIGTLASLYPAWKASRMNIQSVIRSVG